MLKGETVKTQVALIKKDVEYIKRGLDDMKISIDEVKKNTEQNFVTKAEFTPIKQVVYGIVGIILTAFLVALVTLVIN